MSNKNGPTYSKSLSEIFMIRYENGEKEVCNQTSNNRKQQNQVSQTNQPQESFYCERICNDRMCGDGRDLKIGTRKLTENDVRMILYEDGVSTYKKGRGIIAVGNVLWSIGLVACVAGSAIILEELRDAILQEICLAFIGVGIDSFVVGLILKGVGKGRLNSLVDDYNSGRGNALSLSVQPSLMCTYDKSYFSGVGIAMSF